MGALVLAAALADPALGQTRGGGSGGGGGTRGGGGSGGGSGGGGGYRGGGGSGGGGGYHGGGGYRGGGGYYGGGRYYGGYYRPYYGWGWGYPYWSASWLWGWPYWGGGYYAGYGGGYGGGYHNGEVAAALNNYGVVDTDVNPDECEVYLDGKYIGSADDFDGYPDYLYLSPGKYHLEFKLLNHELYAVDLEVQRGATYQIDHKLVRTPGAKDDWSQPEPQYRGMPEGRVFGPNGEPPPQEQRQQGAPYPQGHQQGQQGQSEEWRGDVQEAPRRPSTSTSTRLRFQVGPPDAAIYLDNEYLGAADELTRGVSVTPGRHEVTVVRPGFQSRTVEVDVNRGESADVVVQLEK